MENQESAGPQLLGTRRFLFSLRLRADARPPSVEMPLDPA